MNMSKTLSLYVGVFFFLAACSDSATEQIALETGEPKVLGKDACTLMTLADVQELYGADMKPSERNRAASGDGADVSSCSYQNDQTPMSVATLLVAWTKGAGHPLADRDAYTNQLISTLPDLKLEKLELQGIPSIWQPEMGQLVIFKDGVMATLNADPASGKDKRQTIEALMAKVVAKL